jgi:hypothetical protein
MPDRDVKTIKDLIFYQYAKIIARRAFSAANHCGAGEVSNRCGINHEQKHKPPATGAGANRK